MGTAGAEGIAFSQEVPSHAESKKACLMARLGRAGRGLLSDRATRPRRLFQRNRLSRRDPISMLC